MSNDFINRIKSRFQQDKENGWVFGVCAGAANYWHLDAAIVRVGVLVTGLFMPKIVIAAYLIAWLILDDRSIFTKRKES
jgi:phage shock protein PspC (stress-responsive transcriptional regulator)